MKYGHQFFHSNDNSCLVNRQSPVTTDTVLHNVTDQNEEEEDVNVIITFTNAHQNERLIQRFTLTVSSLLEHSTVPLTIYILGDPRSQEIANVIICNHHHNASYKV